MAASPVLMQQSPSENEKNVQQSHTEALPLDPELNFTKYVYSIMSVTGLQCHLESEGLLKRKHKVA